MDWILEFNARLAHSLEAPASASPRLREAILAAARAPGKRLRPVFIRESGLRFGLAQEAVWACALAVESVHLFSLVHDDLPALDDDDFRRGQPTLHRQFDEATAVLAGDELLRHAYAQFAELSRFVSPPAFSASLAFFGKCIGREGMIGGQMLEWELLLRDEEPALAQLSEIQDLKTGALFRAALLLPPLLAGEDAGSARFRELESFAADFGFAYQIADDLEDEQQDREESSKNILTHLGRTPARELALTRLRRHEIGGSFSATRALLQRIEAHT